MENNEYNYKIGGQIYSQDELTWGQDQKLLNLYRKLDHPDLKLSELERILANNNALGKFLRIALIPKYSTLFKNPKALYYYLIRREIYLKHTTNSTMGRIFQDFFFLNKKLITKLEELGNIFSLIAATQPQQPGTEPAKNTKEQ